VSSAPRPEVRFGSAGRRFLARWLIDGGPLHAADCTRAFVGTGSRKGRPVTTDGSPSGQLTEAEGNRTHVLFHIRDVDARDGGGRRRPLRLAGCGRTVPGPQPHVGDRHPAVQDRGDSAAVSEGT
jgi:hypothetical protein